MSFGRLARRPGVSVVLRSARRGPSSKEQGELRSALQLAASGPAGTETAGRKELAAEKNGVYSLSRIFP